MHTCQSARTPRPPRRARRADRFPRRVHLASHNRRSVRGAWGPRSARSRPAAMGTCDSGRRSGRPRDSLHRRGRSKRRSRIDQSHRSRTTSTRTAQQIGKPHRPDGCPASRTEDRCLLRALHKIAACAPRCRRARRPRCVSFLARTDSRGNRRRSEGNSRRAARTRRAVHTPLRDTRCKLRSRSAVWRLRLRRRPLPPVARLLRPRHPPRPRRVVALPLSIHRPKLPQPPPGSRRR